MGALFAGLAAAEDPQPGGGAAGASAPGVGAALKAAAVREVLTADPAEEDEEEECEGEDCEEGAGDGAGQKTGNEAPAPTTPKQRAGRRSPGDAIGTGASTSGGPPAQESNGAAKSSSGRGAQALKRAQAMGDSLRKGLPSEDVGARDAGGVALKTEPRLRVTSKVPAVAPPERIDAAALIAPGYAPVLQSLGLKTVKDAEGRPALIKTDGTPAGTAELSRLSARLRAEPEALLKRPDFFQVVRRGDYDDLKSRWTQWSAAYPADSRHAGLDGERRDFRWSSSCTGVSGDCNPHAGGRSYKKNDLIPPEMLRAMIARMKSDAEAERSAGARAPNRPMSLSEKLLGLLGRLAGRPPDWKAAGRDTRVFVASPVALGSTGFGRSAGMAEDAPPGGLEIADPGLPSEAEFEAGAEPGGGLPWAKIASACAGGGLFLLAAALARRRRGQPQ